MPQVFAQEQADGLELALASSSIVYASVLSVAKGLPRPKTLAAYGYCPFCGTPGQTRERRPDGNDTCAQGHRYPSRSSLLIPGSTKASLTDFDLHYLKSILVTTGWNKNDDVFDRLETWIARKTPEDKPFNYEHNCSDIIGHITGTIPVTMDGEVIGDVESLPAQFNILTSAVLYKVWSKPELQERMDKLLEEIAEGKWFVSMECLFKGFDYSLKDPEGKTKVVARNESTAFLTKHLRAYGGNGTYLQYRVGRLLRNFVFSGKGLVENPANIYSVIFDNAEPVETSSAEILGSALDLGYEPLMTQETIKDGASMATEIENLTKQLAESKLEVEKLTASLRENDTKAIKAELESAKAEKHKFESALKEAKDRADDMTSQMSDAAAHLEALKKSHADIEANYKEKCEKMDEACRAAKAELDTIKVEKRKNSRIALVCEKLGTDKAKAEKLVTDLSALTDESFTSFVSVQAELLVEAKKSIPTPAKPDSGAAQADTSVLETATPEVTPALSTETVDSGVEKVQASVLEYFGYKADEE